MKIVLPSLLEDMLTGGMERFAREDHFSSSSSSLSSRSLTPLSDLSNSASYSPAGDSELEDGSV